MPADLAAKEADWRGYFPALENTLIDMYGFGKILLEMMEKSLPAFTSAEKEPVIKLADECMKNEADAYTAIATLTRLYG